MSLHTYSERFAGINESLNENAFHIAATVLTYSSAKNDSENRRSFRIYNMSSELNENKTAEWNKSVE